MHFFFNLLESTYCMFKNKFEKKNLLEKIFSIFVAKKWYSVREHPNISTTTIVIGFTPFAIFIRNC